MDFMYVLDVISYGGFLAKILNDVMEKAITQHDTVNYSFDLANSWVIVSGQKNHNIGASFATIKI